LLAWDPRRANSQLRRGYPFDLNQRSRWKTWCQQTPVPSVPLGVVTGIYGRKLGALYRPTCCLGPDRILDNAPVESLGGTQLDARQLQSWMKSNQRQRMADDLIDRVRGATDLALKDWENGKAPPWELVAAVGRLFPEVQPASHPAAPKPLSNCIERCWLESKTPPTRGESAIGSFSSIMRDNPEGFLDSAILRIDRIFIVTFGCSCQLVKGFIFWVLIQPSVRFSDTFLNSTIATQAAPCN